MPAILEVKNLRTYFNTRNGTVKAVDGVSCKVSPGETLALVGESGCGKSVSALSIMQLVPCPPGEIIDGEVLLDGVDLLKLTHKEMRKHRGKDIAMIFQEPMTSLNPVLTIGRQMTEAMEFHLKIGEKEALQKACELLNEVGIPDPERRLHDYPHQLSGGQLQRVMIGIALSCEPKVLLADEPTTAVDVTIQAQLLELIHRLTKERNTALIIITHNLGIVARYADNVNVMYAGRIVETASASNIYFKPRHPYTLGLLASVPRLDKAKKEKLLTIDGAPPDLSNRLAGCAFKPRCRFAIKSCDSIDPFLYPQNGQHKAACLVDINLATNDTG